MADGNGVGETPWLAAWASSRAATCASTVASKLTSGALSPHATSAAAMSAATPTIIRNMSLLLPLIQMTGSILSYYPAGAYQGNRRFRFLMPGRGRSYGGAPDAGG